MSVSDSAVGAILQIPDDVLNKITTADRQIKLLAKTSFDAASAVRTHWGNIAPQGLDAFIRKLAEAQTKMQGMGNINLNLNVGQAQQQMDNLTNTVQTDAEKISKAAQGINILPSLDFNNLEDVKARIINLEAALKSLKKTQREGHDTNTPELQAINNQIYALKQFIALQKQSDEQKTKVAQKQADTTNLNAQKVALERILQLEKSINEEELKQTKANLLGKAIPQADVDRLNNYYNELIKVSQAYDELKTKTAQMSEAGRKKFNDADAKAELQRTNAQADAQEKYNQALQRTSELTQLGKLKTGGIGSSEESAYQRQLVGLYQEQIRLIRQWGDIRARAAADGRALTNAEYSQLQLLVDRYRTIELQLQGVAGKYKEIDNAVRTNFQDAKAQQLADNAAKISAGMAKAQSSTASLVAEYKRLVAENEKLYQSMRAYNNAGGDINNASYQAIGQQWRENNARMQEIERQNIAEINQFRQQQNLAAYQADLSAFVQAEAQKRAEAEKTLNEQVAKAKQAGQQYAQSFQGAMTQFNKLMDPNNNSDKFVMNLENVKRVLNDLKTASGKLNLLDPQDAAKAENLKKKIEELTRIVNQYKQVASGKAEPTFATAQQAVQIANASKTLDDYKRAYEQLVAVMSKTDSSSSNFKQMSSDAQEMKRRIDEIKKSMGEFHNQTRTSSDLMNQLGNRITAAFSVGAIMGFLKNMTHIRAQFELQRVALGAIIQDSNEANKIFTQVQNMALQSPFTIMGLEKATKQIAAFGFETKKLVPTMKMFADIAAGLGVEIDRLVLVMGHLKARNFLEGTMVRQFTNMGFNVLGELSKYYTEIENKLVSVGEVQDRVKKKMVSFEDVEQVLKRVTSAGGMFYDMQKKQSDSIWGQMQRITDAYDLMLNEIGQSNEGIIKKGLTLIRGAINSWRELAPFIKAAAVAMGTYLTIAVGMKFIPMMINNIKTGFLALKSAQVAAKVAQDGLNASMMANPYAAVIAAITTILALLAEWYFYQDRVTAAIDRVTEEGYGNMYTLITQYRELADTVKDATKPYEDRKKALEDLRRIYGEILPSEMLEISNIYAMRDGYKEATEAIKAYSLEKTKENVKNEIDNEYGKQAIDAINNNAKKFAETVIDGLNFLDDYSELTESQLQGIVKGIMNSIFEEVKEGTLNMNDAKAEFKKRFIEMFDLDQTDMKNIQNKIRKPLDFVFNDVFKDVKRWYSLPGADWWDADGLETVMEEIQAKMGDLDAIFKNPKQDAVQPQIDNFNALRDAVSEYLAQLERLKEIDFSAYGGIDTLFGENGFLNAPWPNIMDSATITDFNNALTTLYETLANSGIDDFNVSLEDLKMFLLSDIDSIEYTSDVMDKTLLKSIEMLMEKTDNPFFQNWLKEIRKEIEKTKMTPLQKQLQEYEHEIAKATGITMDAFRLIKTDSATTWDDVAKDAKKLADQSAENIHKIVTTKLAIMDLAKKAGQVISEVQAQAQAEKQLGLNLEEEKKKQEAYTRLWRLSGGHEESEFKPKKEKKKKEKKKKEEDKELKRMKDLQKYIEEVNTEYKKLRQNYDETVATKEVEKIYGPLFRQMDSNIKTFYKAGKYNSEELVNALEVLKSSIGATSEERKKWINEIGKKQAKVRVDIAVELQKEKEEELKKNIADLFSNYDLTNEFKKNGLNIDLTYMLGGVPTTLDKVKQQLDDWLKELGGDKASLNVIKMYKDAQKKISDIELKEQKERLKNYEKYLKMMYSERAKKMIEAYSTSEQMERDFQKNIQQLQEEMDDVYTSEARRKEIEGLIESLKSQSKEAALGIQSELNEAMAKADWERFKGSEIFEAMYQDVETLTRTGVDELIKRLEVMRDKLQSVSNIDPKAVREVTQYIEKLNDAKIEFAPYAAFNKAIDAAKKLKKEYGSLEEAQKRLIQYDDEIASSDQLISDLETIIGLMDKGEEIRGVDAETTARLLALQKEYAGKERATLLEARGNNEQLKKAAENLKQTIDNAGKAKAAFESWKSRVDQLSDSIHSMTDSIFDIADALGGEVDDEWKNFASSVIDATANTATLILQMTLLEANAEGMGAAMNTAFGIIGWIATALQVVASLLVAIFAARDKALERQIEKLQDRVDRLTKSFEKLQKSIERAFTIRNENKYTEDAIKNLNAQKAAYLEMIKLEEAKKKTDKDKIKEYKESLEEIDEALNELYETRHEKWGSTDDVWGEANNWVDAWLDAFKETGDGLDSLNESWDEFYENLVKKAAVSAVLGERMNTWIEKLNNVIDSASDEYGMVDAYKMLGEEFKKEFGDANEALKKFFEYAGIGGNGEYLLSDLQKGIQNITEPQAAAIEAYLNSMRFAVFRHTEQLDSLIEIISIQYGSGADNPIVAELKGIRSVLDHIDGNIQSVITNRIGEGNAIRVN